VPGTEYMRFLLIFGLLFPIISFAETAVYEPTIDNVKNMYKKHWSTTYLSIGGSAGNKLTRPTRTNLSFKHNSIWKYGYNEFDITVINPNQQTYVIEGSYRPSLSLVRSSGVFTNQYPMLDFALTAQFAWTELGERVFDLGFDFHLAPPNSWHYFIVGAYARKNLNHTGGTYSLQVRSKITIARSVVFKLLVDGTPKDQGKDLKGNILISTEILMDIGKVWSRGNQVYLGPNFQYWFNKLGASGKNEYAYGVNLLFSF
jgi:hypothetical protein